MVTVRVRRLRVLFYFYFTLVYLLICYLLFIFLLTEKLQKSKQESWLEPWL